ncbi:hypothetical protein B0H13DRAFT_1906864 [Mycena leptocephala]|nr:hypothetical protein B0H13DRAFT_1906864 [Mycena leptocephala]
MTLRAPLVPLTCPCTCWLGASYKNIPRIQGTDNISETPYHQVVTQSHEISSQNLVRLLLLVMPVFGDPVTIEKRGKFSMFARSNKFRQPCLLRGAESLKLSGRPKGIKGNSVPNWTKVAERNGYCGLEATLEFTPNGVHRPTGSSTILRPWDPWALLKVYERESEFDFDVQLQQKKLVQKLFGSFLDQSTSNKILHEVLVFS